MTIFSQMLSLRDQLVSIAERNSKALIAIREEELDSALDVPVRLGDLQYNLWFDTDRFKVYNNNGSQYGEDFVYEELDWSKIRKQTLGAGSNTCGDLLDAVSNTADVYSILSDLTTKFSYANRVRYSDVCNILDTYGSSDQNDLRSDLFSISNQEGYITLPAFTRLMSSYATESKKKTDNGSIALDTTNPYTLQSFVHIAVQVASATLSVICIALSSIFGAMMAVVGFIIQFLSSVWTGLQNEAEYSYDPLIGNSFVSGAVSGCDNVIPNLYFYSHLLPDDRHVYYCERYGIASFLWYNDNYSDFKTNSYVYPYYRPYDGFKYLLDHNIMQLTGNGTDLTTLSCNSSDVTLAIYNDVIPHYDATHQPISREEVIYSLALGHLLQSVMLHRDIHASDQPAASFYISGYFNGTSVGPADADDENLAFLCTQLLVEGYLLGGSLDGMIANGIKYKYISNTAQYFTSYFSNLILPTASNFYGRASNWQGCSVVSTQIGAASQWPMIYSYTVLAACFGRRNEGVYFDSTVSYLLATADCLPTEFGVRLPKLNLVQIEKVASAIATVTIAAAITATPLRIMMAKRKASKDAFRGGQLNKVREKMLENPDNDAYRIEFENLSYKFDKFGKWFGWGSYDASNGWVNAPTTSTSATAALLSGMYSQSNDANSTIIQAINDVGRLIKSE